MIRIQAPRGLGDAIYLRAIVTHLAKSEEVTVYTRWPMLFSDLPVMVKAVEQIESRDGLRNAAYCLGCLHPSVLPIDLFRRACFRAGVYEDIPLRLNWKVRNRVLVASVRKQANGRPILLYQPLKLAANGEQASQRPNRESFFRHIEAQDAFRVRIGHPEYVEADGPCELDLLGKTSVTDVLDVATVADSFFCEPSFLAIVAEAMGKPFVCMFARRGLSSQVFRVRNLTPERLMPRAGTAIYDEAA